MKRKTKRRSLNRRLKREERVAKRHGDSGHLGLIRDVLRRRPLQNELLDRLRIEYRQDQRAGAWGDGSFLEWLQTVDWERLVKIIASIFVLFV